MWRWLQLELIIQFIIMRYCLEFSVSSMELFKSDKLLHHYCIFLQFSLYAEVYTHNQPKSSYKEWLRGGGGGAQKIFAFFRAPNRYPRAWCVPIRYYFITYTLYVKY